MSRDQETDVALGSGGSTCERSLREATPGSLKTFGRNRARSPAQRVAPARGPVSR